MTIRPVDIKNLMPNTQQLSKIQQTENDKLKNFSHIHNSNQNKKVEKELRQVKNSEKMTKTKITKDNKRDNNNKKQNNNDNNDSGAHEEEVANNNIKGVLGINIDIKI